MATEYKYVKEINYLPQRDDLLMLIRKNLEIRVILYLFAIVGIICTSKFIYKPTQELEYTIYILSILCAMTMIAIFFGKKEIAAKENVTENKQNQKYLLNLGMEVKKCYGSAVKTLRVTDNKIRPLLFDAEKIKRHCLIMATIGAGKTVLMKGLIEQHALTGGGGLAIDGKGTAEFAKEVYGLFASIGREDDFFHINFLDMDNTHTVNPLLAGSATALYEILIVLLVGEENEWKAKQKEFMKNILKLLVWKRDNEGLNINFSHIAEKMTLHTLVKDALDYRHLTHKFGHIEDYVQFVSSSIGIDYKEFITGDGEEFEERVFKAAENSDLQGVYDASNSAGAWRSTITNLKSDYGKVFNTSNPTISMWEAAQRNKWIFVTLPTMASDTTPKELGKLILGLIKGVAAEKAEKAVEPEIPFLILADEIGSYITEGLGRLMSKSRALGISLFPIFQSPAQIDQIGKTVGSESLERREILDVTGIHILMKTIHPETSNFYSDMIPKTEVLKRNYTQKRDNVKGQQEQTEDSFQVEEKPAIMPDEVANYNNGEMAVITDGRLYRATAATESSLANEGKKITYEGKDMSAKIPLTEYLPREEFLRLMMNFEESMEAKNESE
jgi:intracellular multiplication protein IcmO